MERPIIIEVKNNMEQKDGHRSDVPEPIDQELDHRLHRCGHFLYHHSAGRRQRLVLSLLQENGSMSQQDIQKAMNVQAGTISELISKLEHKGFVERSRDGTDRRKVTISLTEAGREIRALDHEKVLQDRYHVLSETEKQELSELLSKLLDSWEV